MTTTIENITFSCGCGRHDYTTKAISVNGDDAGMSRSAWEFNRCSKPVITSRTPHSDTAAPPTPSASCPNCGGPSSVAGEPCDSCR